MSIIDAPPLDRPSNLDSIHARDKSLKIGAGSSGRPNLARPCRLDGGAERQKVAHLRCCTHEIYFGAVELKPRIVIGVLAPWQTLPVLALSETVSKGPCCATQMRRVPLRKLLEPQFPNGIVSSVSFVSTTNTARSLAGTLSEIVLLAIAEGSGSRSARITWRATPRRRPSSSAGLRRTSPALSCSRCARPCAHR